MAPAAEPTTCPSLACFCPSLLRPATPATLAQAATTIINQMADRQAITGTSLAGLLATMETSLAGLRATTGTSLAGLLAMTGTRQSRSSLLTGFWAT